MEEQIVESVRAGLKGFEIGDFHLGLSFPQMPYYQYFSHSDIEVRRYSIATFVVRLGNWKEGSSFHFSHTERIKLNQPELEVYIQTFLKSKEMIKKDFPSMYQHVLFFSKILLEGSATRGQTWKFRMAYPLKKELKNEIDFNLNVKSTLLSTKYLLKEFQLQPFFSSDYFDISGGI
ncbi:hypothetical protein PB01_10665 [Psychrobacillus glaciei]|uniref:Uncharacterized protein n=1 Tax=Psychrobacillus glaciei TaxID=2283160 RepID=A0A5J6SR21_9BACI|nr:hypothetical protein [Psychrobacillus glaciei]QFF99254.1 hypothetical protein PB01_10665 [Psychrobacillus glaciei]